MCETEEGTEGASSHSHPEKTVSTNRYDMARDTYVHKTKQCTVNPLPHSLHFTTKSYMFPYFFLIMFSCLDSVKEILFMFIVHDDFT